MVVKPLNTARESFKHKKATQRTKELCAQITNNLANNQFNIIFLHILFAACGKSTDFIHFFSLIQKLTHLVYLSKVCSVKKIEETGQMEDKKEGAGLRIHR